MFVFVMFIHQYLELVILINDCIVFYDYAIVVHQHFV